MRRSPSSNLLRLIRSLRRFTTFATYLLHNEEFEWTISTDKLRLNALGTIFDNISLEKKVSFKAFNNIPGVTISNFELPSDDDAGGIHIETDALIPSPARASFHSIGADDWLKQCQNLVLTLEVLVSRRFMVTRTLDVCISLWILGRRPDKLEQRSLRRIFS